ncbi:hypothetical protein [Shimia abyssi]|uniref:Outer membrane protein n=1 Tax=Shimia abyssi TaxID=1662395 RepID=A0A2P8F6Y9_9RHOB|nr:hypothetical protein [Shimia abyssi]PSL17480.1 hypothetical protein CLV88_11743 [Shimia abyssi]
MSEQENSTPEGMLSKMMAVAAVATAFVSPAAADPAVLSFSQEWSTDLTGYIFLPVSTTGTSTVAGSSGSIDLSLRDALELLDFAASIRSESWKGDFGLIFDANYLSLGQDFVGGGGGSAQVDVEQYWLAFMGAYRVAGSNGAGDRPYSFDIHAGARYNSLKQQLDLNGPGPGMSFGGTETWWEPVIGARYTWQINDRWTGAVLADAGGFGVNGSDLQFSTTLGFDYGYDNGGSLKLGVRYYSIDYSNVRSDGLFAYDVDQVGPFVGYTFRF